MSGRFPFTLALTLVNDSFVLLLHKLDRLLTSTTL